MATVAVSKFGRIKPRFHWILS